MTVAKASGPVLNRGLALILAVVAALSIAGQASAAWAHDGTSDALTLVVEDGRAVGTGLVAFEEVGLIDTSGDGLIDQSELSAQQAGLSDTLVATVQEHVTIAVNGDELQIIGAGLGIAEEDVDLPGTEHVGLAFATEEFEGAANDVSIAWTFTSPSTSVVVVQDGSGDFTQNAVVGDLSGEGTVTFTLDGWSTASSFFVQGIEHIRLGLDHTLFLIVLTLGVIGTTLSRGSIWQVVKLVTAFTVGHAISLCLAYFDILPIPAEIVEPAIALSIVVVAVLAAWGKLGKHPWWMAGAIGLVHGLGFASSLSELGLATSNHVVALLTFNVGIDVAQIVVVALVVLVYALLGLILTPRYMAVVRMIVCFAIALVGLYWTITRVFF